MLDNHLLLLWVLLQLVLGMVTAIGTTSGGTGLTSIAKGLLIVSNSANTLSALDGGGSNDGVYFILHPLIHFLLQRVLTAEHSNK